jgi:hypothetical protein
LRAKLEEEANKMKITEGSSCELELSKDSVGMNTVIYDRCDPDRGDIYPRCLIVPSISKIVFDDGYQ